MGTKLNPGNYDCYENAKPDEPMFILLARDDLAPDLVGIWRALRIADIYAAIQHFSNLVQQPSVGKNGFEDDKMEEAFQCLNNMIYYKQDHLLD